MNIAGILIDLDNGRPRSGWRVLIFILLLLAPRIITGLLGGERARSEGGLVVGLASIGGYLLLIAWIMLTSWVCLALLDRQRFSSLGLAFFPGWWREAWKGLSAGVGMIVIVVALQKLAGGTRVVPNPHWWRDWRADPAALRRAIIELVLTAALLLAAAAWEELLYRGYAFQTLLRGVPAMVPVLILSILFGLGHWSNPHRSLFSTANTLLAGVWLSLAYLGSRNLWYPTGLHFGWNWMLGPVFGLPISGMSFPPHPLLLGSSGDPEWLTGGGYGSEGGAAATVILVVAILWEGSGTIWRRMAPDTVKSP